MRSLRPVIFFGTTWRSARSLTALQAQSLVLRVSVDVATVDESVAADKRDPADGRVASGDGSVPAAQETGADLVGSNRHAAATAAVTVGHLLHGFTAAVPAADRHPHGATAAAVLLPCQMSHRHPSIDRPFPPPFDFRNNHKRQAHGGRAAATRVGNAFLDIVVIRQLAYNYLNNFPLIFLDADNPHGVDERIC